MHHLVTLFVIWQPICRARLLERVYKQCTLRIDMETCRVCYRENLTKGVSRERGVRLPMCCNHSANKGLHYIIL